MASRRYRKPPKICPQCGEEVPPNALACPECGSDYETGWSDEADINYASLDLPDSAYEDDDFDYDEFTRREFGGGSSNLIPKGMHPAWWITAIVLLVIFFLVFGLSG